MRLHRAHLSGLGVTPSTPAPAGYMWICGSNGCQLSPIGTQVYDSAGAATGAGISDPFSADTALAYAVTPNAAKGIFYDGPDVGNTPTPIGTPGGNTTIVIPSNVQPSGPTKSQITAAAGSPAVNATVPVSSPPLAQQSAPANSTSTTTGSATTDWLTGSTDGFSNLLLIAAAGVAALFIVPRLLK